MAAKSVIGIPELLREIASYIYAPASLSQLCLVNSAFKDAFVPQLYRCLRWDEKNIKFLTDPDRRRYLLKNNKLAHTKTFIITRSGVEALHSAWKLENRRKEARWRHYDHWYFTGLETIWTLLNDAIIEISQHAHGLQTFASQDIAICCDTVAALSSISSLRNISIEFHQSNDQILWVDTDATEQVLERFSHPEEHFVFTGLKRLSLLGIWGDIIAWRKQLLKVILHSPELEFLALSLAPNSETDESDDETYGPERPDLSRNTEMFQWLSREYAKATGGPLHFRFTKFHYRSNGYDVEGWANPHGMDVVYIWNEDNGPFLKGLEVFPVSDIGPQP